MKITKPQMNAINELYDRGGAVLSSEWTNGMGRHTTRRTVPPYCDRIVRREARNHPKRIRVVFERHPRAESVVAITNMRAVNKWRIWFASLSRGTPVRQENGSKGPERLAALFRF